MSLTLFNNIILNSVFFLFIREFFLFIYSILSKRLLLIFTYTLINLATYFIKFFTLILKVILNRIRKSSLCFNNSKNLFKFSFKIEVFNSTIISSIYKLFLYSNNSEFSFNIELINLSSLGVSLIYKSSLYSNNSKNLFKFFFKIK